MKIRLANTVFLGGLIVAGLCLLPMNVRGGGFSPYQTTVTSEAYVKDRVPGGRDLIQLVQGDAVHVFARLPKRVGGVSWLKVKAVIEGQTYWGWLPESALDRKPPGAAKPSQAASRGPAGAFSPYPTSVASQGQLLDRVPGGRLVTELYDGDPVQVMEQISVGGESWVKVKASVEGKTHWGWLPARALAKAPGGGGTSAPAPAPAYSPPSPPPKPVTTARPPQASSKARGIPYDTTASIAVQLKDRIPGGRDVIELYAGDSVRVVQQISVRGQAWAKVKAVVEQQTYWGWIPVHALSQRPAGAEPVPPPKPAIATSHGTAPAKPSGAVGFPYETTVANTHYLKSRAPAGEDVVELVSGDPVRVVEGISVRGQRWVKVRAAVEQDVYWGWLPVTVLAKAPAATTKPAGAPRKLKYLRSSGSKAPASTGKYTTARARAGSSVKSGNKGQLSELGLVKGQSDGFDGSSGGAARPSKSFKPYQTKATRWVNLFKEVRALPNGKACCGSNQSLPPNHSLWVMASLGAQVGGKRWVKVKTWLNRAVRWGWLPTDSLLQAPTGAAAAPPAAGAAPRPAGGAVSAPVCAKINRLSEAEKRCGTRYEVAKGKNASYRSDATAVKVCELKCPVLATLNRDRISKYLHAADAGKKGNVFLSTFLKKQPEIYRGEVFQVVGISERSYCYRRSGRNCDGRVFRILYGEGSRHTGWLHERHLTLVKNPCSAPPRWEGSILSCPIRPMLRQLNANAWAKNGRWMVRFGLLQGSVVRVVAKSLSYFYKSPYLKVQAKGGSSYSGWIRADLLQKTKSTKVRRRPILGFHKGMEVPQTRLSRLLFRISSFNGNHPLVDDSFQDFDKVPKGRPARVHAFSLYKWPARSVKRIRHYVLVSYQDAAGRTHRGWVNEEGFNLRKALPDEIAGRASCPDEKTAISLLRLKREGVYPIVSIWMTNNWLNKIPGSGQAYRDNLHRAICSLNTKEGFRKMYEAMWNAKDLLCYPSWALAEALAEYRDTLYSWAVGKFRDRYYALRADWKRKRCQLRFFADRPQNSFRDLQKDAEARVVRFFSSEVPTCLKGALKDQERDWENKPITICGIIEEIPAHERLVNKVVDHVIEDIKDIKKQASKVVKAARTLWNCGLKNVPCLIRSFTGLLNETCNSAVEIGTTPMKVLFNAVGKVVGFTGKKIAQQVKRLYSSVNPTKVGEVVAANAKQCPVEIVKGALCSAFGWLSDLGKIAAAVVKTSIKECKSKILNPNGFFACGLYKLLKKTTKKVAGYLSCLAGRFNLTTAIGILLGLQVQKDKKIPLVMALCQTVGGILRDTLLNILTGGATLPATAATWPLRIIKLLKKAKSMYGAMSFGRFIGLTGNVAQNLANTGYSGVQGSMTSEFNVCAKRHLK